MKYRSILAASMCLASLALHGCGGKNLDVTEISPTANPTEQITSLEASLNEARNNKVNMLSPTFYAKAQNSLATAKEKQKDGNSLGEIFKAVASGRAQLEKANEHAKISRMTLGTVIEAHEDAQAAGAASLGEDYEEAKASFRRLMTAVEDDNLDWAKKNQPRVTERLRSLELRAIKERALGQARDIIQDAEKKDAKKIVPKTLAMAKTKLADADAFISQNRYNKEKMLAKANKALFHAERLQTTLNQSLAIRSQSSEQTALWMENMLSSISQNLSAPDMRNQSFKTQVANINGTIAGLQNDQAFLVDKTKIQEDVIMDLNQQVASLEGMTKAEQEAKAKLEAEKRFNKLYTEVRTYFDANEAEVYKKGDQLLIRLKAMKFPVGESVIMPNNYPLLSKVQHAIRTFGEPKVTIEGHTDTTGSAALNEHLSEARADAVKQYFIANRTLSETKLVSVGYGPDKPVAPNTTTEGRAMNRRIDVVISPEANIKK